MESCYISLAGLELMIPLFSFHSLGLWSMEGLQGLKWWFGFEFLCAYSKLSIPVPFSSKARLVVRGSTIPCQLAALPAGFKVIFCAREGAPVLDSALGKGSLLVTLEHGRPTKQVTAALTLLGKVLGCHDS